MTAAGAAPPPTPDDAGSGWEAEGRAIAAMLDSASAVAVLGDDVEAAAHVALGIGRVQSQRRRVAIGDLAGEVGPLQSLVRGDDSHGIVDSFRYGVSLNKIAYPADRSGNLYIMPSGSEPVVTEEIFRSERWRRLAVGFGEVGALLLLVAPASAAGVDVLVAQLDGAIVVGDPAVAQERAADGTRVLHVIARVALPLAAEPAPRMSAPDADAGTVAAPADDAAETPAARWARRAGAVPRTVPMDAVPDERQTPHTSSLPELRFTGWRRGLQLLLLALMLATLAWVWLRPADGTRRVSRGVADSASIAPAAAEPISEPAPDDSSEPIDSASAAAADAAPRLAAGAASDTVDAAPWVVQIIAANTVEGADAARTGEARGLPLPVVTPVALPPDGARWYRLTVGAFPSRAQADSFTRALRRDRKMRLDAGNVIRAPLTLLVQRDVAESEAPSRVDALVGRGIPAYWLLQPDGSARLYAGAFETTDQAAPLAAAVRSAGITPRLVFRTGRIR